MTPFERAVANIVKMAEIKMDMNRHKGDITTQDNETLIRCAHAEIDELRDAIAQGTASITVVEEAADVFNFLIGIVAKELVRYEGRKSNGQEDRTQG